MTSFRIYIRPTVILLVYVMQVLFHGMGFLTSSFRPICIGFRLSFANPLSSSGKSWWGVALWLPLRKDFLFALVSFLACIFFLLCLVAFLCILGASFSTTFFTHIISEHLNVIEHAPLLPDMSIPGALIPDDVLLTCSECRAVELERDSVRAETEMLRRRLEGGTLRQRTLMFLGMSPRLIGFPRLFLEARGGKIELFPLTLLSSKIFSFYFVL